MTSRIGRAFNTVKKYATLGNLRKGIQIADAGLGLVRGLQGQEGRLGDIARKVPKEKLKTLDEIIGVAKKIEHVGNKIATPGHPGTDWSSGKPVAVLNPTRAQLPFARRRSSMDVSFPGRRVSAPFDERAEAERIVNAIH